MNVYQIVVTCAVCEAQNSLILTDKDKGIACEECGQPILSFRKFEGCVYVLKNNRVDGVKIGMTSGDVFSRARQVSGTGVPGHFQVVAAFHSRDPRKDERKIHAKLARHNIEKEHFNLDPVQAVVKIRTILKREFVYLKPQYEQPVASLIENQRKSANEKFSSNGGKKKPPKAQRDLFDGEATRETAPVQSVQKPPKSSRGGVFSFLFD